MTVKRTALTQNVNHTNGSWQRQAGASLIEVVVSMSILTVLLISMGSAIVLAAKAIPNSDDALSKGMDASRMAQHIAGELMYAINFSERSANAVEFTVADRDDADSLPETIRYAWSGNPGDPLTRQFNGGSVINVLEGVEHFNLVYKTRVVTDTTAQAPVIELPEQVFVMQDSSNSGIGSQFTIASNARCAEYFLPVLPVDAVQWRITRASFVASPKHPANGTLEVSVKPASGNGKPSGTLIDSVQVPESNFTTNTWYEVTFGNAGGLDPTKGYFIAFERASGGGTVAYIDIGTSSLLSPTTTYYADDGGGTWQEDSTIDIWLWVWGTVTAPDPSWTPPTQTFLYTVGIALQTGGETASRMETSAPILSRTEVF